MARIDVTYTDYQTFGGQLDEDRFLAVLSDAQARVDERIAHRSLVGLPVDEIEAYKMAVCAVCAIVADAPVKSYSASKVSVQLQDAASMTASAVIDRYLSSTEGHVLYGAWL